MFMNHDGDAHGIQNENVVVGICQCNVDSGSELTALIMATTLLVTLLVMPMTMMVIMMALRTPILGTMIGGRAEVMVRANTY